MLPTIDVDQMNGSTSGKTLTCFFKVLARQRFKAPITQKSVLMHKVDAFAVSSIQSSRLVLDAYLSRGADLLHGFTVSTPRLMKLGQYGSHFYEPGHVLLALKVHNVRVRDRLDKRNDSENQTRKHANSSPHL